MITPSYYLWCVLVLCQSTYANLAQALYWGLSIVGLIALDQGFGRHSLSIGVKKVQVNIKVSVALRGHVGDRINGAAQQEPLAIIVITMRIQRIFTVSAMEVVLIIMVIMMEISDGLHHEDGDDSWRRLLGSCIHFVERVGGSNEQR